MKKYILLVAFMISGVTTSYAQYVLKNQDDVKWYENLPQEDVTVHSNASLVFAGEALLYKTYVKNAMTKSLSKNSKIAYVELVGKDGAVFKHKIRINNGIGQGDFFIPVTVKTGRYKLIGYTRWMLNRADDGFFQTDLTIINPYAKIDFDATENITIERTGDDWNSNRSLSISTNKSSYGMREKVHVVLESADVADLGVYSITVRKMEDLSIGKGIDSHSAKHQQDLGSIGNRPRVVGETIFLPEFKGEMITGRVTDKVSGEPVAELEIALSVLSEEAIQDVTTTNNKGIFYFQIQDDYKTPRALIQVLGDNRANFKIDVNERDTIDYSSLTFNKLSLNSSDREIIIEHSVNNQIENAYLGVKQDQLIAPNYPKPFYGNPMRTYKLDDYKRFTNVAETLDEVVDHAYHERRNGKTRYINVRERETDPYYDVDILPMVVVDGASIQDHQNLLSFETKDVESMSVLRQEYYYGDKVYQGVLLIDTFNKDYFKNLNGDHLEIVDLEKPELRTRYFQQDYSEKAKYSRIPDQRTQLLWIPEFDLKEKRRQVDFYTSDVSGTYVIKVEGFTTNGDPVTLNKTFKVE